MDLNARCIRCFYPLRGLPEPRCPECGLEFHPDIPSTYTTKPPFVRWRFWLPGLLLAVGIGLILWLILFNFTGVGWAATIAVPFAIGSIIGYTSRVRLFSIILLALIGVISVSMMMMSMRFEGLFCGILLGGIALGPLLIGSLTGWGLRAILKATSFDQRSYLPIFFFALFPLAWAAIEGKVSPRYGSTRVQTSTIMNVSPADAWNVVLFYEEVKHAPPLLLRLGLSRPLYSIGKIEKVGDEKTCVYDQGKLVKRVTEIVPGRRLAFVVTHQSIERCACQLVGGSFEFQEIGPNQTRVTLTTEYKPFLAPRFAWGPTEELSAHTLHQHVLLGMQMKAVEDRSHRSEPTNADAKAKVTQ